MSDSKPSIVVLGGININFIGVTPRLPKPGETVTGDRFYINPGGKGANQAVAAARMGAAVRMVGRVGRDSFGPDLLDGLAREGIDASGVAIDPDNPSGVAVILLDGKRQNHIVQIRGANLACDEAQVEAARAAMAGARVLMLQLELPFEVSLAAARHAKRHGVAVLWDPAPTVEAMKTGYGAVDILAPNQGEAEFLTGIEVKGPDEARRAARKLRDEGVATVVIKLGEQGAYFVSDGQEGLVAAPAVDVVDTVGAGDAFGGALAVALAQGRPLPDAVRWGVAAGALAVTKQGAQASMPVRRDVEALLGRVF
ncbi:MAG: ribokinase [SAR202 cluster bacterium]|nr:ribokinase [SAR202 cluster bacterium]